jgi:hypothetical protein
MPQDRIIARPGSPAQLDPSTGVAPLGYAGGVATADSFTRRPWALVLPNLIAIAVLFLPVTETEPPIRPLARYAGALFHRQVQSTNVAEALLTAPFLLPIPLAVWTIRLAITARSRWWERLAAWCATATAVGMTLIACAYCLYLSIRRQPWFLLAVGVALPLLVASAVTVRRSWRAGARSQAALFAATLAYATNTIMTVFIVRAHFQWAAGSVLGAVVSAAQLAAVGWLSRGLSLTDPVAVTGAEQPGAGDVV